MTGTWMQFLGSYFYIYFCAYLYLFDVLYLLYINFLSAECFNFIFSKRLAKLCLSSINTSADKLVYLLVQVLAFLFFFNFIFILLFDAFTCALHVFTKMLILYFSISFGHLLFNRFPKSCLNLKLVLFI